MAERISRDSEESEPYQHRRYSDDATDLAASMSSAVNDRIFDARTNSFRERLGLASIGRRSLGIFFLLVTVFLWTLSNFLASSLFSDNTYDKPFFVVYLNSSFFAISLAPRFILYLKSRGLEGMKQDVAELWNAYEHWGARVKTMRETEQAFAERLLDGYEDSPSSGQKMDEKLGFHETAILSLEFSLLWFVANFFASACFEYTSVASGTILSSTSSVWTLMFCALWRIEAFTLRKFIGVLASVIGVILVSMVDLSKESDENRGSFPHKTPTELLIGNGMALLSAVIYGLYITFMKRRVGDENRVDMQLFFGLVGLFNLTLLWPIIFVLHYTGLEPFQMPPSSWVWIIIITNSLSSYISDVSWALAMLLTTPLVVTVGLSLTIPLSLIGEMIHYGQHASFIYWVGAAVVFVSFLFINHESHDLVDKRNAEREEEAAAAMEV